MMRPAVTLFWVFCSIALFAQQGVVSSGGDISGNGGETSFSIGQIFYLQYDTDSGFMSEGVQSPYDIQNVGVNRIEGIKLGFQAYPIPTTDILTLSAEGEMIYKSSLNYMLFDLSGRLLAEGKVGGQITQIIMKGFEPGIYILRVLHEKHTLNVFKITKR